MIDRSTFLELADIHQPHCISIYMQFEEQDKNRITLKNLLSRAEKILEETYGLDPVEIFKKLQPLSSKVEDTKWLNHPGRSLAAFIYDDQLKTYEFEKVRFENRVNVSNRLFLMPLASLLHLDNRFYFLVLSGEHVQLYDISLKEIRINPISGKLPDNIKDAVGYDVEQKSLQFRSGQEGTGEGMFHGQGAGTGEEKKKEYEIFFRNIDQILTKYITDKSTPLVLGCVEKLFPIYKEVNSYPKLWDKYVQGNFDDAGKPELQEIADKVLGDMFKLEYQKATEEFEGMLSRRKASYQIEDIIPSALDGRIDSLIIQKGTDIYGTYDPTKNKVKVDAIDKTDNTSLLNKAAIETIEHDGDVYLVEEEDLPVNESRVNAVYRYSYEE